VTTHSVMANGTAVVRAKGGVGHRTKSAALRAKTRAARATQGRRFGRESDER
jgi:hypothetical protein